MHKFGYVMVFVSDMDKSIAFYRDTLGSSVKHQSQNNKIGPNLATQTSVVAFPTIDRTKTKTEMAAAIVIA